MIFVFVICLQQFFWAQQTLGCYCNMYANNNIATCPQTHRDVSIVHCVRTYNIVYSTPYRLFLFVAENRLTYSTVPALGVRAYPSRCGAQCKT